MVLRNLQREIPFLENKIKLALIYGSSRAGRFCDTIAAWAIKQIATNPDFLLDVIDPSISSAGVATEARAALDAAWLRQHVGDADAFIVVTPEYNHGYPAALKSLIDSVGAEWQAKPVAFVSYGGISGGIRAVEQLRQVFGELHAVSIRDSVAFSLAWEQFGTDGVLKNPERAERQMQILLKRLSWWAKALREARNAVPYAPAA